MIRCATMLVFALFFAPLGLLLASDLGDVAGDSRVAHANDVGEIAVAKGTTYIATTNEQNPAPLTLGKRKIAWVAHPTDPAQKIAILTIPYREKPQIFQASKTMRVRVLEGDYRKETINVAPSHAKPNKQNQQRIERERKEAQQIYSRYTPKRYWDSPFALPLNSAITSPYGSARIFNGEIASYHSGTDFRANIGTPIAASNDGVVVIAKDRFLAGGSVVIDHGQGIFSMYYHCSELKVSVGDAVKKGDLIALSGNSGRVSGPHLHFGFLVNGAQVDPLDFIDKINLLF